MNGQLYLLANVKTASRKIVHKDFLRSKHFFSTTQECWEIVVNYLGGHLVGAEEAVPGKEKIFIDL